MQTKHIYGLAAMLAAMGIIVWMFAAVLWYIGLFLLLAGTAALIIGLVRFALPIAEQRHVQAIAWQSMALQSRVIAHAERLHGDIRREANGTIEVTVSRGSTLPQIEAPDPEPEEVQEIPANVRYEDIVNDIPVGHSLLGVSANGIETCDFKDLMTMLISGGSSTGKSNTVAIKLDEAMRIGRNTRMLVIDPHKNKPDSLYNKIAQYEPRFLCPVAQKDVDVSQALRWFKGEFERRMELSTEELEELDDILLICDEVYGLCFNRSNDELKKLIKIIAGIAGYESRGYGMYAWFLTQKVSGLKWLRDAVMTTICHKMQTMSERVLASNDDRAIARDMDNWTMPGRVVVFGLNLSVTVAQMPLFVSSGRSSQSLPTSTMEDFGRSWEVNGEVDGRISRQNEVEVSPELAKKILTEAARLHAAGESIDGILKKYGLPGGGRLNQNLKALLEEQEV